METFTVTLSPPLVGSFEMQNLSCSAPVREHQKLLGEGTVTAGD